MLQPLQVAGLSVPGGTPSSKRTGKGRRPGPRPLPAGLPAGGVAVCPFWRLPPAGDGHPRVQGWAFPPISDGQAGEGEGQRAGRRGRYKPPPWARELLPVHPLGHCPAQRLRELQTQSCPNQFSGVQQQTEKCHRPIPILNTVLNKMNTAFSTFGIASVACLRLSSDETLLNAGL